MIESDHTSYIMPTYHSHGEARRSLPEACRKCTGVPVCRSSNILPNQQIGSMSHILCECVPIRCRDASPR
jgi:hypothetical protein